MNRRMLQTALVPGAFGVVAVAGSAVADDRVGRDDTVSPDDDDAFDSDD